jgi:hypothetical protein
MGLASYGNLAAVMSEWAAETQCSLLDGPFFRRGIPCVEY